MSLTSRAVSGVKWSGLSMVAGNAVRFVRVAVLARLLAPADFGLMGMVMVVLEFGGKFTDIGLSNALVHRKDVPRDHLSSFFWINVIVGVAVYVLVLMLNPLLVLYFRTPELSRYLTVSALVFLIAPLGQTFTTLLRKELRFRTLSQVEIGATVVDAVSAIGFALAGFGVMSLVFAQLFRGAYQVLALFVVFRRTWLPSWHCRFNDVRGDVRFGLFQLGERAVNYLCGDIDYIIVGRFLGATTLGYYKLAYELVVFPLSTVNPMLVRVLFPAFSLLQNDQAKFRNAYCRVIKYIAVLAFPMMLGMMLAAPQFVLLVYGAHWAKAIPLVQIMCLVGIFKALGNPTGSVLLGKGRANLGFYLNVISLVLISLAVVSGLQWGIVGVATGVLLVQAPILCISMIVICRLIELPWREYFRALESPLLCSALMFVGVALVKLALHDAGTTLAFVVVVATGVLFYTTSYLLRDRAFVPELLSLLKAR